MVRLVWMASAAALSVALGVVLIGGGDRAAVWAGDSAAGKPHDSTSARHATIIYSISNDGFIEPCG